MSANPSIGSVPLADPGQAIPNQIPAGTNPYGLAASERYLYWANAATNSIRSATLSGGSPATLVPGGSSLTGVAVTADQFPDLTVDDISPNPALTQTTVSLTITGSAFDSGTTVAVGNQICGSVQVNASGTSLTCSVTSSTIGTFDVTVKNSFGQQHTVSNGLRFVDTPGFASTDPVAPASATISTSTLVRINGVRFVVGADTGSSSTVEIGGTPCIVDIGQSTSSTLFCTLASTHSTVQTVDVVVTNPSGAAGTLKNGFKFQLPPPIISGISPNSGFASQSTNVTITGTGFQQGAQVAIVNSSYACTNVTVAVGGTSITCTVPSNRVGPANVVVTNPDDQRDIDQGGFAYLPPNPTITSVTPATGSIAGGTSITVAGTGFVAGAAVSIGGQSCTNVVVASPLSLTCVTASGSQGGAEVAVTNPNGQAGANSSSFSYVIPAPDVTSIQPAGGDVSGGTTVTVGGSNLLSTTAVTIGGNPCTDVTVVQPGESLTCTAPAGSNGATNVVVTNDTLSTTITGGYTYGNANHVFFSDSSSNDLSSAEYGGANIDPDFLTGLSTPGSMVSDGTYLYWINGNSIGRVDLDGTNSNPDFITALEVGGAAGLAVDSSNIYWSNPDDASIYQAPISGGTTATQFVILSAGSTPEGIAVDATNIYWVDSNLDQIGQAPLANPGSVNDNFVDGANAWSVINEAESLTVSGGNLYWANEADNSIGWVPLTDPGMATPDTISTSGVPTALTANGHSLFWTNAGATNTITQAKLDGTDPSTFTTSTVSLAGIAVAPSVPPAPAFSSINPATGSTAGGEQVTITGTGFGAGVTATVGGVGCAVTSSNATEIVCITGPAAAGTRDVVIVNPDVQTVAATGVFTITNPAPTVSTVSPSTGSLAGGYSLDLTGTGFIAGTTVQAGSNNCPVVSIAANGQSLTCTVPAGSVGSVNVSVSAPGSSTVSVTNAFTYSNGSSLYWANSGSPGSLTGDCSAATSGYGSIGFSNSLAGTSINQCLVVPDNGGSDMSYPSGVATDGTYIYWADSGSQVIGRADADGSNPKILINLGATNPSANPTGVTVSGSNIYWADGGFSGSAGSIGYANLDGSSAHQHWITLPAGSSPSSLAITGGTLYWSDSVLDRIGKADLATGTVTDANFVTTQYGAAAVTTDGTYLYWANNPGTASASVGAIGRVAIASPSSPDNSWISDIAAPSGVATDGTYIYWTTLGGVAGTGLIGRANLDGTGQLPQFKVGANSPIGVAILTTE